MRALRGIAPRLAAAFAAAVALAASAGCGGGGGGAPNREEGVAARLRRLDASVDPGDPAIPAAAGYAGSNARGLRTVGRPGVSGRAVACDSDGDGKDDFREGLDLSQDAAFSGLGGAALRLTYVRDAARPYRISIGGVWYDVERVYGGSRREDYLVRLGRSHYLAPLEYDLEGKRWIPLENSTWFSGASRRFANVEAAAAGIDRSASFERRCAGCHGAGFSVQYDAPSGEWLTGYTELGVGCENCHGPALDHVLSGGEASKVLHPRGLADGSAAGAARADDLCARCHTRGEGGTVPGAPAPLLYPWSAALGRSFMPGDDVANFVTATTDPSDFWGRKDNYLSAVPTPADPSDDSFIAARSGYMQSVEQASGAHAPSNPASARCIDCHAAHGSGKPSEIVARSAADPDVKTTDQDGSLCLACHAGRAGDPFEGLGIDQVALFAKGRPSGVRDSVVAHMKDMGMPVADEDFQPRKTGVGRCTACHMPSTATERRDPGGPGGGTHLGFTIGPAAAARHGMPGSCNGCHAAADDPVTTILEQWATGDPDGDGRYHGYTPRGEMLGNLNASSGNGLRCAQCHTTKGFREIRVEGDPTGLAADNARLADIVKRAARLDEGIGCAACHGKDGTGAFAAGDNPLRVPRDALCGSCHFSAGITFEDYTVRGQAVHFPQQELLDGTAGEEPPSTGPYPDTNHSFFPDRCVKCHFDTGTPGATPRHDFQPRVETCQVCHPASTTVDVATLGDYDGDGALEGIQGEVSGLLEILKAAILAGDAAVSYDPAGWGGFKRGGVPGLPGASAARQRAAYNWEVVSKDGSRGAHNAARALRLLQQSYRELTGVNVPGAAMR